jgi:hypothetical protein
MPNQWQRLRQTIHQDQIKFTAEEQKDKQNAQPSFLP